MIWGLLRQRISTPKNEIFGDGCAREKRGRRPSPNSLTLELPHLFDTTSFHLRARTGWISLGWAKKFPTHKK
jgi:hypothetical protein